MADSDDEYGVHDVKSSRSGYEHRISRQKHKSLDSEHGMPKSREEEQYRSRDKERKRNHDHRVDKGKAITARDDRRRGRHDDEYHTHDYERNRDRDKRHTGGARSPSRERYRKRSRSPSHSKSKRESGFDMAPPVASMFGSGPAPLGATQVMSGGLQNIFPVVIGQATRHARRVYVGGLPPSANEQTIATFFSQVMTVIGGNSAGPGDAVINVYINHEKKFAFLEMRSVEEASNAMALDGITFEGVSVRVRRPADYNPALAATLGPSQPSTHLNLAAIGLMPGATVVETDVPDRIFVGGIPYSFTEVQIRQLLESFGPLKGFDLVKDRDTGNSKGYGFCNYQDPGVTEVACQALNGLKMGDKTLTVRRATVSNVQAKSEQQNILAQAQQHLAMQRMALQSVGTQFLEVSVGIPELPTKVLCLTEVLTADTLKDDNEYEEILEDMREECGKFGVLVNVVIPRPNMNGDHSAGVGKVFLEYADTGGSTNAKNNLGGRKFGGNSVSASYYPEAKFYGSDFS